MVDTIIQTLIKEAFGREVLYVDDFKNNKKTIILFDEIRKLIKEKSLSITAIEYLKEKGLYQSIESDMRVMEVLPRDVCSSLKDYIKVILNSYPLFGFANLTDIDNRELYTAGNDAFQAIAVQDKALSSTEQDMLIMSTIQLLKSWQPKDDEDSAFWSHVYRQYGYKDDHDETLTNRIYGEFRRAVRDVLSRYNRYMAPSDTHRYYTTLMLHALSPKQSMMNLFEILIRFFEKNLLLQFIENDTSYRTFVENIKARWDVPEELQRLGLYSAELASGLRTLFINRPYYMAKLCESIVKRIDAFMRQGVMKEDSTISTYLDTLLHKWYQEKSEKIKAEWVSIQAGRRGERVFTLAQFTHPLYVLTGKKAALLIPSIRLDKTSGNNPTIQLFQNELLIYEDELDVYGNELCWTTHKKQIVLEDTALSFKDSFNIRMEILFNGASIFDSKERLYRSLVFFSQTGNEISPTVCKRGPIFLLAGEMTELESKGLEESFELSHAGRLLELLAENIQDLRINGNELFTSEEAKSGFRIYPSKPMVIDSWFIHQGERIPIFREGFNLSIHLPIQANHLPYIVQIDQTNKPLSQYCEEIENMLCIEVPSEPWGVHSVYIKDILNSSVVIMFKYIIIPAFSVKYDKHLFVANNTPITGTYRVEETETSFSARLNDDLSISLITPYQNTELVLQPPVFSCTMADINIFENDLVFWYKDINQNTFLTPAFPPGWNCSLNLDNHQIPPIPGTCKFDIGNFVHSYESKSNKGCFWFSMQNASGEKESIIAFNVIFKPIFLRSPLIVEGSVLYWRYKENYFGPKPANFQVKLYRNSTLFAIYSQIGKDEVIERSLPYEHGYFSYQIFFERGSMFNTALEEIHQGDFTLGSPDMLRFTNHNIDLSFAVCWDEKGKKSTDVSLFENAARIFGIAYIGNSIPSGEEAQYPEYQGNLCFLNSNSGTWQHFNSKESNVNFELINPVKFWIINDNILILHTCTDDGLYFDKFKNQIINRDPYSYIMNSEIAARVDVPDYFRYVKKELPNAQSN